MSVEITISQEAIGILNRLGRFPGEAIAKAMDLQNEFTVGHIQQARLSQKGPETLGVVTGLLRRSIRPSKANVSGNSVQSSIGTNVVYAGIHEFGGTIPARTITAINGKALRFSIGGRVIFAKKVNHPGATIPARAPIRRGIEDRRERYGAAISQAIVNSWEGAKE